MAISKTMVSGSMTMFAFKAAVGKRYVWVMK